jgi:hypothetical protein
MRPGERRASSGLQLQALARVDAAPIGARQKHAAVHAVRDASQMDI